MLAHLPVAATMLATLATSGTGGPTGPAIPTLIVQSVTVTEGDAGMTAFESQVTLVSGAHGTGPYVVDLSAMPSSATPDDFVFQPVRLSFMGGDPPQTVRGFIVGDPAFEGAETFWLRAVQPPDMYKALNIQDGQVTITDDDIERAPQLTLPPPSRVTEGNGGSATVTIPISLSAAQTYPVTFDFITSGGRPGDYRATTGTITLAPGDTVAEVAIEIFGDTSWEKETTLELSAINVKGALVGTPSTTITITNDDPPTTVTIGDSFVFEGDAGTTSATLVLSLSAPASGVGELWLDLTGGSALLGEDFLHPDPWRLIPEAGATEMRFTIDVLGDTRPECDEGVLVRYWGEEMGDDTKHTARLMIVDDDGFPKDDPRCPDPFVHTNTGSPIGRRVDAGTKPPIDGGAPASPDGGIGNPIDGGNRLPSRGCCSVASGVSTPSAIVTLLLAAAVLLTTRRRG